MNWMMSELVAVLGVLVLSSLTGTAVLTAWYLAGRFLGPKGYFPYFYRWLRLLPAFFLFPFTVLLLRLPYFKNRFVYSYLFWPTPAVYAAAGKALVIWGTGVAILLASYLYSAVKQHLHQCRRMPCSRSVVQVYDQVCREMGGRRFPGLYQSYGFKTPVLAGVFHPVIYLPVSNWTKGQLRVVFIHELNHYRHGDLWLKWAASLLAALQWVNPAVWIFRKLVASWSEYSCDWCSYPMCGGKKAYFQAITEMALEQGEARDKGVPALVHNTGELERRVTYMKWCGKKRKGSIWGMVLLAAVMVLTGAGTAFASVRAAGELYYGIFQATDVCIEEILPPKPVEYQDDGPEPWVKEEIGEVTELDDRSVMDTEFNWTIGANESKKTGSFYVSSGKIISIMVFVSPNTESVRVGIMKTGGNRTYVKLSNGGSYTFKVAESGNYQVFVENTNKRAVEVSGLYKTS